MTAGGEPNEAIRATHGMPIGNWVPGMRGHLGIQNPGKESGIGPSYGPGAPYTATNTQSIVEAITKGVWAQEAAEAAPTAPIDITAPPGKPPTTSPVQDGAGNGSSTPPVVTVGQGQSKKKVIPAPLPGGHISQGEKPAAAVIAADLQDPQPASKVAFENYTQEAINQSPPWVDPQAARNNTRNANVVNGRKATGGVNQSGGFNPLSPSPMPTPRGYMQGAVKTTKRRTYGA